MKFLYTLFIFLLFALHNQATAQCSTSVPNFVTGGSAGSAIPYADSYVQTFKPTCNSVLTTIVFPTLYNGTDDFRGQGYFVTCIIKDASGNILATAPRTDQWYPGATVTYDFTCFNISLTANTTYQFELKDGDANGVPVPKVWLLQRSNTASVYADGFCTIDGVAFPNSDLYGWTVNSGQNIIASATTTQTQNVTTCSRFANPSTTLLTFVNPVAPNAISGNTTAKVWIETLQPAQFVKRHYEITPATNTTTAKGKVTLYFTQQEFTDFNAVNVSKLPTGSTDAVGISNLILEKRPGSSSDGTGLPNTYTGTPVTIDPADAAIVWNSTLNRWEVSFDVVGFGGFFLKSVPPIITASTISGAFTACAGTASATQTFTVSGTNLTANISITAPTGYEVSTASGSGFGSSVTLTQTSGSVASTPVYVRMAATATGTPSGNITLTSTGATAQNVAVSGTVNALPTIALGSVSNITTTATTFSLPYTATTGSPNQYSITAGTPNVMAGFSAVSNASLTGSPLSLTVPASAANTYSFVATVRNSTTGCVSANNNFTVGVVVPTTPFKTTWKVANGNIIIPTSTFAGGAYNYTVNYRKQGTIPFTTISGQTSDCTISGLTDGDIIEVEITGGFPHFYMNSNATEKDKLLSIEAWGNQNWKNMSRAFQGCSNLVYNATDSPDLSSVTSMLSMFAGCSKFNGVIGGWNTSNVTDMSGLFSGATIFNQPVGSWNTDKVTSTLSMFQSASKFNQPLTNWNTSKVTDMANMFSSATDFNQDLSVLELDAVNPTRLVSMLNNSGLSVANYDATLTGWLSQNKTGLTLSAGGLKYCASEAARTTLITPVASGGKGWTISGDAKDCTTPFKTTWKVAGGNIIIPTNSASGAYNYTVKYRKQGTTPFTTISGQIGNCTISGLTNDDIIEVEITGIFPQFYMNNNSTQRTKLLSIDAWGNQVWKSMNNSFGGCNNLTYNATDNPDLSAVTDMSGMFRTCTIFNGNIGSWNTSNVTNMSAMFSIARAFNQPIGSWNTSNVTNMSSMFISASAFNQNIGTWNTANVTNMNRMFSGASAFNQPIGTWNTANVTDMNRMFGGASAFNQPIGTWNTANVTNMSSMFGGASAFNQPIGTWNTANVTDMNSMFVSASAFNQNIGNWITNKVTSMSYMFSSATSFNQNISNWTTVNVIDMSLMFYGATDFNQNIGSWNTSSVINMSYMFLNATAFNQPIGSWNTGNVTTMQEMFRSATSFNQNVGTWNTANVTNMSGMFNGATAFNENISSWITSNVTDMNSMFSGAAAFNQNIGSWNTSNVVVMGGMFQGATAFNQPVSSWNTSNVVVMSGMFQGATAFNQPVGSWNTSNVTNMVNMFQGATAFNQNIGDWNVGKVSLLISMFENATAFNQNLSKWDMRGVGDINQGSAENMLKNSGLDCVNYSATLLGWANNAMPASNVKLGDVSTSGVNRQYGTNATTARTTLGNTIANGGRGWIITGDVAGAVVCSSAPPAPIASAQSYCQGKTVADLVATGQNIQWYNALTGGTALASTTVLATGTYYASQTVGGVESERTAVSVTINALPVLNPSSNSPVCSGQTLFLYAKGENQSGVPSTDTYTWTGVNSFTANTQNPFIGNVGMNANGVYTVSATNSANCSASATILVTVKETPTLVVSNFTNPTPENNPDGTISFTTNLPNSVFSLNYSSTGSPRNVTVNSGAFILNGLVSGVYGNFAVTNDGCTGRNNTEVTLLSTPFTLVKSITTGNWESNTTWNIGRVPKAGDVVIIDGGHSVTINGNCNIKDMEVRGRLIYGAVGIIINLGL
jgi:surface protein